MQDFTLKNHNKRNKDKIQVRQIKVRKVVKLINIITRSFFPIINNTNFKFLASK